MPSNEYQIGQLIAQLGLDTSEFQRGMNAAQAQMNAANQKMQSVGMQMRTAFDKVGTKMQAVGRQMNRFVTLPLIGIGTAAFKMHKDFEASMSKIQGLVGASAQEMKELTRAVLDMAPAVGRGPEELADALFFVKSAGIQGKAAIEVLNMSAKASAAGLGETKTIADLVTSAMKAYGEANLNAAQATDILIATVREGKAEATDLAGAMGQVLPISSAMGVTFDQVGAAMAAMTRTGTNAAVAATQLKAILSGTLSPAENAEEAMMKVDLSSAKLRKTIEQDGLLAALLKLKEATSKYGKETVAEVFPNIRALLGVLDLMGANAADTAKIFESLKDSTGALDVAVKAASETTQYKWNQAVAQVKVTLVETGAAIKDIVVPVIEKLTDKIRKIGERFDGLSDSQKEAAIKTTALVAAMGPLLSITGRLFKLIASNPYVALAAAIASVVGLIVRKVRVMKEEEDVLMGVERATKNANDEYERQRSRIQFLVREIEDENLSNEARIRAITELKRIMPDYNGQLTEEGKLLEHNKTTIEDYVKALEQEIFLKAFREQIIETTQAIDALDDQLDEAKTKAREAKKAWEDAGEPLKDYGPGWFQTGYKMVDPLLTAYRDAQAEVDALTGKHEELLVVMEELKRKAEEGGFFVESAGGTGGGGGAGEEVGGGGAGEEVGGGYVESLLERALALREGQKQAVRDVVERSLDPILSEMEDEIERMLREEKIAVEPFVVLDLKTGELIEKTAEEMKKLADIPDQVAQQWADAGGIMIEIFNGIGSAIQGANQKTAAWLSYIGRAMGATAQMIGVIKKFYLAKQMETAGVAASKAAELPFPANIIAIAASIASVLASFAAIPKFAEGALAFGPVIGQMGEYPGASHNPEVIAPLSDLKKYLQPRGSEIPKVIELRLKGSDFIARLDYEKLIQGTY